MPKYVQFGEEVIEFPDSMSDDEIAAVLRKESAPTGPRELEYRGLAKPPANELLTDFGGSTRAIMDETTRQVGLAGRGVMMGGADLVSPFTEPVRYGMSKLGMDVAPIQQGQQAIADSIGLPSPQTDRERLVQQIARVETGLMSGRTIDQPIINALTKKTPQMIAKQGLQNSGYVLPPREINPTGAAPGLTEGLAGKINTKQLAQYRNQINTQRQAAKSLGLDPDTQLNPGLLQELRSMAHKAYEAIKTRVPILKTDAAYRRGVDSVVKEYKQTSQAARSLGRSEIDNLIEDFNKKAWDAPSAVELVKRLRAEAGKLFQSDPTFARIKKGLADQLESLMERRVSGTSLYKDFTAARKMIAKTYSIEKAMNADGIIDARALGRQLSRGKPLSGELKTIARFAAANPEFSAVRSAPPPSVSPLGAGATVLAGAGHPAAGATMAGYAAARGPLAGATLSGPVQRALTSGAPSLTRRGVLEATPAAAPYSPELLEAAQYGASSLWNWMGNTNGN